MITITSTKELEDFCSYASNFPYVTIDTEFLREKTYYAKLCLIQLAVPGKTDRDAVLIDPLRDNELSLESLFELFKNKSIVKVFHACRQDLEIFYNLSGFIPEPLFDTQIAAMVCNFGDQVSYEKLVEKIVKTSVDKTSRFTDWSRRPLTSSQEKYALGDVTHLRDIYENLVTQISETGRQSWIDQEMNILQSHQTYEVNPREVWRKVKVRSNSPKFLAIVRELAEFRELSAIERNIPRARVFKDDVLLELASSRPNSVDDLLKGRLQIREFLDEVVSRGILDSISRGINCASEDLPKGWENKDNKQINAALADLLRVLLKAKAEEFGVSQKLIASVSELDELAKGQRDLSCLSGWRYDVFGKLATRLCEGRIGLTAKGSSVSVFELSVTINV